MESKQQESGAAVRVPFLPGMSRSRTRPAGKTQRLAVSNGVMLVDPYPSKAALAGADDALPGAGSPGDDGSGYVRKSAEELPGKDTVPLPATSTKSWIKFDGEVLRFTAYFSEPIESSALEKERVRRVTIQLHLADSTVTVFEPRQENSGIPQGVLLKRHRVPKSRGSAEYYKPGDFVVGASYTIYGREYHVVGADSFTRRFYAEELGLGEMQPNQPFPADAFAARQVQGHGKFNIMMNDTKKFVEANLGRGHIDVRASKQFFERDGKVLRFYCTWSDPSADGEKHPYTLQYYLADDTVEVSEIKQANSGREQFPSLLKRSRLPKDFRHSISSVASIGAQNDVNAAYEGDFVKEGDLRVGGHVNVYGRDLLLCGCDDFTKAYYKDKYGLAEAEFSPIQMYDEPAKLPRMATPPYNGFGTEEDSLGSFNNLVPRPPRKDLTRLMKLDGKSLRFLAALANPAVEDTDRRFVITYYMADDTVSIFEKVIRNSGFVGGKFLERSRVRDGKTGDFIKPQQFFVGAKVLVNQYRFHLVEADEYTLNYMQEEAAQFPQADVARVMQHLRDEGLGAASVPELFKAIDTSGDGRIDKKEFTAALEGAGFFLTDHEVLTILRHFDTNKDGKVDLAEFARGL